MSYAIPARPLSEANCPLRRAIMAEAPAAPGSRFALLLGVLILGIGVGTGLVLSNLGTLSYYWVLLMELCT